MESHVTDEISVDRDVAQVFKEESSGRHISTRGRASRKKGFKGAVKFPADLTTDKTYKQAGEVRKFSLDELTPLELGEMLNNSPTVRSLVAQKIEREHKAMNESIGYAVGVAVGTLVKEVSLILQELSVSLTNFDRRLERLEGLVCPQERPHQGAIPPPAGRVPRADSVPVVSGLKRRRRHWGNPQELIFRALMELENGGICIDKATEVAMKDPTVYRRALKIYGRWGTVIDIFRAERIVEG